MKKHARHLALSGVIGPLALILATVIANEAQTLLGLHLDNVALALYLAPFLAAAAAILHAQLRLESASVIKDLGEGLTGLFGGLDLGEEASPVDRPATPTAPPVVVPRGPSTAPSIPPPPAP